MHLSDPVFRLLRCCAMRSAFLVGLVLFSAPSWAQGRSSSAVEEKVVMKTRDLRPVQTAQATESDVAREEEHRVREQKEDEYRASRAPGGLSYRLGPGDELFLMSFDDESLNRSVTVRYDGYISLPLIPDIRVADTTREEATEAVKEAYTEIFNNPLISLSITSVGSKVYTVIGDVAAPNEYPYLKKTTLLSAITTAGGLRIDTRQGDSFVGSQGQITKVFIITHGMDGERNIRSYDMSNLTKEGHHDGDVLIYPGDIVYVPEGINLVYVVGEVRSTTVFELTEGMTLLQLLIRAGGFDETTASLRRVVLMHEVDAENTRVEIVNVRKLLRHGGGPRISAGDIIYIPRSRMTKISQFVQKFTSTATSILGLYTQSLNAAYAEQNTRHSSNAGSTAETFMIEQLINSLNTTLTTIGSTGP